MPSVPPPSSSLPPRLRDRARLIAGSYAVFAGIWIYGSDRLLLALGLAPDQLLRWSVYKGWAFVGITTFLLWLLMRRALNEADLNYAALADLEAQRRRHERELERVQRLYASLSHINQAIVRPQARDEIFAEICRILVREGGFGLAWVGWHDPDTRQLVPRAEAGDENGYLRRIKVYADDRPEGLGPSGLAFRSGQPVVCNDVRTDEASRPWRAEAVRRGLHASAAIPLREDGVVRGVLNVYAFEAGFFRDKEVALLQEAASDLSFALDARRRDEERRRAEIALRQERDFSDAVLASLPGVLYLYDQEGRFLRWNRNFELVTGYSAAEVAALQPNDFFPPAERDLVTARIAEVFARGQSSVEAGFRTKAGTVIPYYFTGVRAEIGGRICLVGVGIDVTERRRAEAGRQASEARYRTLFEYAPDGILIADGNSTYLDANASICRMLGYARAELVGRHAADIVGPAETAEIVPALAVIKSGTGHHREWIFRRKDGSTFPAEVMATLMPDGNLLGMVRDVSERKAAERALRELNDTLEHKVVARTEELRAALVRAEAADRLKSAFLATMSHELRTPLNSIIGFTGIVLQGLAGPLTAEQSRQLGMVRGSARHLLELINDVLDISKIEAGQLEVRREPFPLRDTLERVIASVRPLAEKKGLALVLESPADPGSIEGDRRRTEQILLNLLNNAVKFTEKGGVTLAVECLAAWPSPAGGEPGPAVRLAVRDTGIGIKPADLGQLFQPFRQIDTGLARQHEGTGLGLAICRRLAGLLGGEISVASTWGRGSQFAVSLPRRSPPPA